MAEIDDLVRRLLDDTWAVSAEPYAEVGEAQRLRTAVALLSTAADLLYLRAVGDPLPAGATDAQRQTVAGLVSALMAFAKADPSTRAVLTGELQRFSDGVLEAERIRALEASGRAGAARA